MIHMSCLTKSSVSFMFVYHSCLLSSSESSLFSSLHTATHDIVNASASQCNNEGVLNISCTFAQNTTASGYLAVISNANCSKDTIFLVEYNTAGTDDLTDGVGPWDYIIAFYDLESDGLPAHSSEVDLIGSARTAKVTITDGTRDQSLLGMYYVFFVFLL